MIVAFIIGTFLTIMQGILSVLPTIPTTPASVVSGGSWVTTQVGAVISVLNMLFSPTLVAASMIIIIGVFNFEWVYHVTLWVLKKIPMFNVK